MDQEGRSRGNNLSFFDMEEEEGVDCLKEVHDLTRALCNASLVRLIKRAYRLRDARMDVGPEAWPLVVKFMALNDWQRLMEAMTRLPALGTSPWVSTSS